MEFRTQHMTANEARKMALLIMKAADIEMSLSGYGECAVNPNSGNVYLWSENYPFSLYIAPSYGDRIHACWANPETGDEEFIDAHGMALDDLEEWAAALERPLEDSEA